MVVLSGLQKDSLWADMKEMCLAVRKAVSMASL